MYQLGMVLGSNAQFCAKCRDEHWKEDMIEKNGKLYCKVCHVLEFQ